MPQHEPPGCHGVDVEDKALQRARRRRGLGIPDNQHLVRLTDGLAAERRELRVGEIEHVVVAKLLLVEPARDRGGVEVGLAWQRRGKRRGIDG
jgi:hypothetical protein